MATVPQEMDSESYRSPITRLTTQQSIVIGGHIVHTTREGSHDPSHFKQACGAYVHVNIYRRFYQLHHAATARHRRHRAQPAERLGEPDLIAFRH